MSGDSTLAQYGGFDLELMQEAGKGLPAGGGNFFKPEEGTNIVRFLPPPLGKKGIYKWYKHHFSLGSDSRSLVCAKYQYNQHCPLCAEAAALRATGLRVDAAKAKAYDPKVAVYVNIVDMQNPEKGVQLWTMGAGMFKDIMTAIELAGVGKVFADPVKGYNILFVRKGQKMQTKYSGHTVAREPSPLPDAETLLASQIDLEACENPPTDDEQDEALGGHFEVPTSNYQGGNKGRRREREVNTRPSRGAAKEPDYDDEEDVA